MLEPQGHLHALINICIVDTRETTKWFGTLRFLQKTWDSISQNAWIIANKKGNNPK